MVQSSVSLPEPTTASKRVSDALDTLSMYSVLGIGFQDIVVPAHQDCVHCVANYVIGQMIEAGAVNGCYMERGTHIIRMGDTSCNFGPLEWVGSQKRWMAMQLSTMRQVATVLLADEK